MTRDEELKLAVGRARQLVEYLEYALAFEKIGDREHSLEWERRAQALAAKLAGPSRVAANT